MGVRKAAAALAAVFAWPALAAESIGPLARVVEDPYFDELPVVLSVSRLAQPLHDAPGSVTVIDADTIRTSGARDLADLLRLVPGFFVAHSVNGAPNAVYHGMTDDNPRGLQILIDGRSQYSPLFFGGVAWNLIDVSLDEIDRIEVIRGSNSAAYGSNAFLGVVNVITRSATETQGVRVRVGQGNDGIADRYARLGVRVGDGSVRVSAETMRDNNIKHFDDRREHRRINLRADMPLGPADELQVEAGAVDMRLRMGEAGETLNPARGIESGKAFGSLAWQHATAEGGAISLRFTHTTERYRDDYTVSDPDLDKLIGSVGLPTPFLLEIDQRIDTVRDELEFQHTLLPSDTTRFVWGAGARYDAVEGRQFYGRDGDAVRQAVHRLFGNFEWRPSDAWTTNLGMTWENDSLSNTSLAPRLAVNHHLSPRQTLRAGVSRAHRIPSLTEAKSREHYGALDTTPFRLPFGVIPLEIQRDASGRLDKEVIDVTEIGYLGDFREQGVFVDVRVFEEKVKDRIMPVSLALSPPDCEVRGLGRLRRRPPECGNYIDYMNAQDLDIRGAEYQLRWSPLDGTDFTLNQSFIVIDSKADAEFAALGQKDAAKAERHMENSAPRRATMLRWVQKLPAGAELSMAHFRYGRFQWTPNTAVKAFHRTDVRVAYPFRIGPTRGEVSLTGQGVDGRRAEFKERDADGTSQVQAQFISPRVWAAIALEF
ncbi:TonB-dependent receptor [Aromatoleum toluclasticum]|uniref:TonB-dependent receptor plug domain-containing protein n=1 Tax=Aromatoleum toluclasticum TaxID=92003 RepID=UPI001D1817B5|nr:TonB-dependent receptor [Aromatoleum toluclasticum]MCC4116975.1 TonB-dependent receptor [Aromatoleum toluclasticum]